jgi:pimeloyl-ACP methyl ester carboxylesterase
VTPPKLVAWILPRAAADLAGRHNLVPVTAPPGEHGAMTLPGEAEGFAAAVEPGSPWRNEISPGVFATVAMFRPVRAARRIAAPLWAALGERDVTVDAGAVERVASRAPQGELHRYPYDHFEPLSGEPRELIATDQLEFLARVL